MDTVDSFKKEDLPVQDCFLPCFIHLYGFNCYSLYCVTLVFYKCYINRLHLLLGLIIFMDGVDDHLLENCEVRSFPRDCGCLNWTRLSDTQYLYCLNSNLLVHTIF